MKGGNNVELEKEFIDKRTGITYTLKGEYYIPNIAVPKDTKYTIGRFGKAHLKYIKEYNNFLYTDLILNGKLNRYLHSIDKKCNTLLESIIKELAKQENITEELKANNQLEWLQRMNNIKNRAEEIVYSEYVYV